MIALQYFAAAQNDRWGDTAKFAVKTYIDIIFFQQIVAFCNNL